MRPPAPRAFHSHLSAFYNFGNYVSPFFWRTCSKGGFFSLVLITMNGVQWLLFLLPYLHMKMIQTWNKTRNIDSRSFTSFFCLVAASLRSPAWARNEPL